MFAALVRCGRPSSSKPHDKATMVWVRMLEQPRGREAVSQSHGFVGAEQEQGSRLGRIAGVDFGNVRIGIAISDPGHSIASPWKNLARRGLAHDAEVFRRLVAEEQIELFVVGLPVHCDGRESKSSQQVRSFAAWLKKETAVPVVFFDERFTTVEAEGLMLSANLSRKSRKERRDMLAAQILLTSYLQWRRSNAEGVGPSDSPGALDAQ